MNHPAHVDLAIARRIVAGDEQALRSIFDQFFPRLFRFARARLDGDDDAASEVVQKAFCQGVERMKSYRGEAALYTWFSQICRNVLVDYCRARNREQAHTVRLEDEPQVRAVLEILSAPAASEPETGLWRVELCSLIQTTVDALPDHYGDVLEWKYAEGLPLRTIAGRLGIGEKAAESLLGRARDAFRKAFGELAGTADILEPPGRFDGVSQT